MKWIKVGLVVVVVVGGVTCTKVSQAGVVDPPIVNENLPTFLDANLTFLNAWTGIGELPVTANLTGTTAIIREQANNAFLQGGRDTIDTEIVSMDLTGTSSLGPPVEVRVGVGNGIFPGLTRSGGQVQDLPVSPVDGNIDLPADGIFDVFFDVWIDLNTDNIVDIGEVVRNQHALRMRNSDLDPISLESDPHVSTNAIDNADPNIGMFNANGFVAGPLDLFVVDAAGNLGPIHAQIDFGGSGGVGFGVIADEHIVVPEPSAFALAALGVLSLGFVSWRRRRR